MNALLLSVGLGISCVVLSYIPACELAPPKVSSVYVGDGAPRARSRTSSVDVFLRGDVPRRRYAVVGYVQVLTRSRNASLNDTIARAKAEARRLGGDAIVDVWPRAVPGDTRGRLLTAEVARWIG
ncbi:MAG TPA: hypothetical protein VFQ05_08190 [Candidatus Eisenbacteria bacterium]|nr:hypothetical protein [Candidatus Eisenbacteria bacterium]